jgi:hypothetical protein
LARYTFVVLSNPVDGREDEMNDWYDNVHLDDVLAVPGCVSAQRYRFADTSPASGPYAYLAVYEWEAESVAAARAALDTARAAGGLPVTSALDGSRLGAWFFEPIGDRRERSWTG